MTCPHPKRNIQLIRTLPEGATCATAVAIGNFDGLHKGHQAVIAAMRTVAETQGLISSVLTFEPHPRQFFKPGAPRFRLESLRAKLEGLAALGVARVYMPRFNAGLATCPAQQFLDGMLRTQLGAAAVVTGENFVFGHARGGNTALLTHWGNAQGVTVVTVPPVQVEGGVCSSSAIRAALVVGDMRRASSLLGRTYRLQGRVVHGDGRGRTLGYPTANIAISPTLMLPQFGVYAVRAFVSGREYGGVANLGLRPTFVVDNAPKLEVHLFDSQRDLYGKRLEIRFVDKIRDEKKFDSMENLKAQIADDARTAHAMLGGVV